MILFGKGFKVPGVLGKMDSIPVGEGSHRIQGAAANAEDTPVSFPTQNAGLTRNLSFADL